MDLSTISISIVQMAAASFVQLSGYISSLHEGFTGQTSAYITSSDNIYTRYLRQGTDDKITVVTVATQALGAFLIVAGVVAFSILLRPLVQAQIAASRQYQPL